MILRLILLFTLMPAIELYLLLRLGQWLGAGTTVLLILVTGAAGAWMAKREGVNVLRRLSEELSRGLPPAQQLAEGACVVCGGLLLVTPGVITDLMGFILILPLTRPWCARMLIRQLAGSVSMHTFTGSREGEEPDPAEGTWQEAPRPPRPGRSPFDHPVS